MRKSRQRQDHSIPRGARVGEQGHRRPGPICLLGSLVDLLAGAEPNEGAGTLRSKPWLPENDNMASGKYRRA